MSDFDFTGFYSPTDIRHSPNVKIRCPHCRNLGIFPLSSETYWRALDPSRAVVEFSGGVRFCPNHDCSKPVFVLMRNGLKAVALPAETLDFDPAGVPASVVGAFEEAVKCHASQCYRASALMVRRTLEEICSDRGAEGRDLKDRIGALASIITIPKELLDATDQLRVLGNDAAHIDAREYEQVGREEVEVAIDLAKEILKATYQYADLLGRLKALGRSGAASEPTK